MLTLVVVTGAILKCDKGASPSILNATVPMTPLVDGKPVATILDNKPAVNVMPFGVCAITKMPCVPVTPIPWVPGETTIPLPSLFPILTEISLLPCLVGGIIKVQNPGQTILSGDCKTDSNALREILEFLKSTLTLRDALEFALSFGLGWRKLILNRRALILNRQAAKALGMANDAFKRIFGLNLKFLRWRAGQLKMSWNFLKKGVKLKTGAKALGIGAKALGALGNVLGFASIGYDVYKKDYKGAAANAIGFGAGAVCAFFAAPTVVGVAGCAALSVGVSKYARYAIDNPKKALEIATVIANPPAAAVKYGIHLAVDHRDDIKRGAEQARDFAVDKAGDALEKGKDLGEGVVKGAGEVLKRVPKPKLWLF